MAEPEHVDGSPDGEASADGPGRRASAQRGSGRKRIRRIVSSVLLQSTALAGTLAGVPLPFYGRGLYLKAYAQANCTPSSTANYINDRNAISSTTFNCTIPSNATASTPQYVYGGSYTFYQDLKSRQYYIYDSYTGYTRYYEYHRPDFGQPGLNVKVTNSADISVTETASTQSAIATSTASNYLYRQASTQSNALAVVSRGGNNWFGGYGGTSGNYVRNDGAGGPGGDITIQSSGSLKSTVGGGIYALSRAGDGAAAYRGGDGGSVFISVTGDVNGATSGIVGISQGGTSSGPVEGYESNAQAGDGGNVTVGVYGSVAATQSGPAVLAASYGGNSPRARNTFLDYPAVRFDLQSDDPFEGSLEGGQGGKGGTVTLGLGAVKTPFSGIISTAEAGAIADKSVARKTGAAVAAASIGGEGHPVYRVSYGGYEYYSGGDGGSVSISATTTSEAKIETGGAGSPGILAQSAGGQARSGYRYGYTGGDGGTVSVGLAGRAAIVTSGDTSSGIVAQSLGGAGQSTISDQTYGKAGKGGQVTVTSDFSISTKGNGAHGIVAQSAAAAFGYGIYSYDGNGDFVWGDLNTSSIGSDTVSVNNTGTIATAGVDAHGIIAQSIGGGGGVLTSTAPLSTGDNGGVNATNRQTVGGGAGRADGADVTVTNKGDITTTGGTAPGGVKSDGIVLSGGIAILAQSIGGGGGVNGGSGAIGNVGGGGDTGSTGSAGGTVTVTNDAALTTSGADAHGIVAQSIGGGGGAGRNGNGLFFSVGGTGGAGGGGGNVSITNGGKIATSGHYAAGVIGQSIGGGGGQGGSASAWGLLFSSSIGGSGGLGGDGANVVFEKDYSSDIATAGDHAPGILLQSIGGGGGTGGAAKSYTGGLDLGISLATGGSGGSGGGGGEATAHVTGKVSTEGTNSAGAIVQSIGGGGGQGGAATANALTLGIPFDEDLDSFALTVSIAHGGTGGVGGNGGYASGFVDPKSSISTRGDGASALIVQSIGGGGGQGGDATAATGALSIQSLVNTISKNTAALSGKNVSLTLDVSLGGSGGDGGDGGTAYAHVLGDVSTAGKFSTGVLVQSIGGGGGEGGTGENGSITTFGGSTFALGVSVGGSSANGGVGGTARGGLHSTGTVTTTGHNASALVVHSIGGGGGMGGSGSGDLAATTTLSIGIGASGGDGGDGGSVYAWNAGTITTRGDASVGIVAQSIGGGGGVGGSGTSSVSHSVEIEKEIDKEESDGIEISDKIAGDLDFTGTATLGASGGASGDGGSVYVGIAKTGDATVKGSTTTYGVFAHGVLAQSIGGGGGTGGVSSNKSEVNPVFDGVDTNVAILNLGGSDGTDGSGGDVTVYAADILTRGFGSHGVVAQSIGGGGGHGMATGYQVDTATVALGGDATGDGESVRVQTEAGTTITTVADYSSGVVAQSIGGGGGLASIALGTAKAANDPGNAAIAATFGSAADTANGGSVTVVHSGDIGTQGTMSMGIVAQSISNGGGFLATGADGLKDVAFTQQVSGYQTAETVSVEMKNGSNINTSGDGAVGILAQSIQGGGGVVGTLNQPLTPYYAGYDGGQSQYSSIGGPSTLQDLNVEVSIDYNSSVVTTGKYAHGIVAQAIAGGGGIFTKNGKTYAGSLGRYSDAAVFRPGPTGPSVTITVDGSVFVADPKAFAVWAQTTAPTTTFSSGEEELIESTITVTVDKGASITGLAPPGVSGGALYASGNALMTLTLNNYGDVNGNVVHHTFDGTSTTGMRGSALYAAGSRPMGESWFKNQGTGTFVTGGIADIDKVFNAGTLDVGGTGTTRTTRITGDLLGVGTDDFGSAIHVDEYDLRRAFAPVSYYSGIEKKDWRTARDSRGGLIAGLDVDMAAGTADKLIVEGDFSGTWGAVLNPTSLLPNTRTELVRVDGADRSAFSVLPTLIFSFTDPTTVNGWKGVAVDRAEFVETGVALGGNAHGIAGGLQSAWDGLADGSASTVAFEAEEIAFDEVFAAFHGATPKTLEDMLRPLASQTSLAAVAGGPQRAIATANSVLSCPAFSTGSLLQEGECVWASAIGSFAKRDATRDTGGFERTTRGMQAGGQTAIDDDWFIGGAIVYEDSAFEGDTGGERLDTKSVAGALALKREMGSWLFGLAGGAGYSFGSSRREITLGPLAAVAKSSPNSAFGFARARASYQLSLSERFYMRPMVDFDVIAVHQDGYTERGAGALNLVVDDATEAVFGVTPGMEIGARLDIPGQRPARLFAAGGLSFLSDDSWDSSARFAGLTAMDSVTTSMPIADTIGRVSAGIDLQSGSGLEMKFQYDGAFADGYQSHGGSFRLGYRF